jgi:hypothetical protein
MTAKLLKLVVVVAGLHAGSARLRGSNSNPIDEDSNNWMSLRELKLKMGGGMMDLTPAPVANPSPVPVADPTVE